MKYNSLILWIFPFAEMTNFDLISVSLTISAMPHPTERRGSCLIRCLNLAKALVATLRLTPP
jgi:hypothetical protein